MIDSDYFNEKEKQIERIPRYLPFQIQWLDSSYQQTCLPDSPWHRVKDYSDGISGEKGYV